MSRFILAAAVVGLLSPSPSHAQAPETVALTTPPAAVRTTGGWAGYGVVDHAWSTSVALQVTIPAGSSSDREGLAGTAWLLGQAMQRELESQLAADPAQVTVDVKRGSTTVTALVLRDDWANALSSLQHVLFSREYAPVLDEGSRARLREIFTFEGGLPDREFDRELHLLLSDGAAQWSDDPRGSPSALDQIGTTDLSDFRLNHYDQGSAVLTVAGAADAQDVADAVEGRPIPLEQTPHFVSGQLPMAASLNPAWTVGGRTRMVREITSGWIGIAYPVAPGSDHTALEFFIHRVYNELVTEPPAPGLFSATVELERLPSGSTVLLISAAVLPENMTSWENRILRAVRTIQAEDPAPDFYQAYRRQFRSSRLLADSRIETQTARTGADLLREGRVRRLADELLQIGLAEVQAVSRALGEPRIMVFGPDLGMGSRSPR